MIEKSDFRAAMARLGAAVNLVTTRTADGPYGMVASAVCSVSDDPASMLVCVNRNARGNRFFRESGIMCLNVLAADQRERSTIFTDPSIPSAQRFADDSHWNVLETGAPVLSGALASLDCRITNTVEAGTHTIFLGEVVAMCLGDLRGGLMYFDRDYHRLQKEEVR